MAGTYGVTETTGTELKQLVAGNFHATKSVTIASGSGVLTRGTVLGQITSNYKWTIMNPGASDGSQTARAILAEDVDATSNDKTALAYFVGEYREADIVWYGGMSDAQKNAARQQLADRGIILK